MVFSYSFSFPVNQLNSIPSTSHSLTKSDHIGSLCPDSHLHIVTSVTPTNSANCFCVRPIFCRRDLMYVDRFLIILVLAFFHYFLPTKRDMVPTTIFIYIFFVRRYIFIITNTLLF